jgi:hypothetical protein
MTIIKMRTVYVTPYGEYQESEIPSGLRENLKTVVWRKTRHPAETRVPDRRYSSARYMEELIAWSENQWANVGEAE